MPEPPDFTVPRDSEWFDPVTKRIDHETGLEISADDWQRWEWIDVTTRAGYEPGVHQYIKTYREAGPLMPETPDFDQIAPTRILKMLADGSGGLTDEAYDAMEADARAALIALFVRPECELVFSEGACENNYAAEDRFLYLGSHLCGDRKVDEPDAIYVELWAWIDPDDGSDYVTWNINTAGSGGGEGGQYPIAYCPFCGSDLREAFVDA